LAAALGLSRNQTERLFALLLPTDARPSHATIGRWVETAALEAGRVLKSPDKTCQTPQEWTGPLRSEPHRAIQQCCGVYAQCGPYASSAAPDAQSTVAGSQTVLLELPFLRVWQTTRRMPVSASRDQITNL
jgi:hypothetical protein